MLLGGVFCSVGLRCESGCGSMEQGDVKTGVTPGNKRSLAFSTCRGQLWILEVFLVREPGGRNRAVQGSPGVPVRACVHGERL